MHVEVGKHFIEEKIERWHIYITYVSNADQSADILMKGLPKKIFNNITNKLSMKDIFKPTWEGNVDKVSKEDKISICFPV